jgi:C4-dicarboxylate-specific signal transduction histidine kinase
MQCPLRILHLEDDAKDAELLQALLESEGIVCQVTRVDSQADFLASIERGGFDLILADHSLPSFDGFSALKITLEKCPDVPFIFVSGTLGEEVAIEALKIGATDYVLKERLLRIVPSVRRAIQEGKERAERRRAEEALLSAQAELAHVTRVMTMGELAASIAHEVNQPLAAVVTNANACLRWLAGPTPNMEEAREAAGRIIRDGKRASDVIGRIRALVKKSATEQARLDINEVMQEVIGLIQSEIHKSGVVLRMELAADLPRVLGDRVQLQQVILNLMMNGIEAMRGVTDRSRELVIRSCPYESDKVLVAVRDSGVGLQSESMEHLFRAFFTTKPKGMGMGLAVSRSIVENHGGKLWASPNDGPGMTFEFALPVEAMVTRNRPEAIRNVSG